MMKKIVCLLLCAMMMASMCMSAYAANTTDQIVHDGGINAEHSNMATVGKTIKKAESGKENEFEITLTVETPITVKEVQIEQSAAVVVVIDNSGSMGGTGAGTRLTNAKNAARSFVRSFADVKGNPDARRMVAVVEFHNEAFIKKKAKNDASQGNYYWFDVTNSDALEEVAGDNGLIAKITNSAGTSIEAGLRLGQNLLNHFWKKENVFGWTDQNKEEYWSELNNTENPVGKNIVFLTDGVTICRIKDGVTYNEIEELDELKKGESGHITGNDPCYADDRYTYDSYETEDGKIKVGSDGKPVLKSDTAQITKFHYQNAPYTATTQLINTANEIRATGITLFGIAVDMEEIYVEKAEQPHSADDEIAKHHITAYKSSENSAYNYYPSTTDWMAEKWCDFAYPATNNLAELNSAFSSVLANAVPTWKVSDKLPHYMSLVGDNNDSEKAASWLNDTLTWDLQNSEKTTKNNTEYYTYTYNVALDPTKITPDDLHDDGSVNTNEYAVIPTNTQQGINQGDKDTEIDFPHPTIKSDPATIRVIKVDGITQKPLPNATFTLEGKTTSYTGTDNNYKQEKSTASQTNNGTTTAEVSFSVTGGEYTLTETATIQAGSGTQIKSGVPEGYEENNRSWQIKASFGTITNVTPTEDFVISTDKKVATMTLSNTRKTGSLTIANKEGDTYINQPIDRDKAFEYDVYLQTETYYGSKSYVNLENKEFTATLTDKNSPNDNVTPLSVTIRTDANGKAWIVGSDGTLKSITLGLDDSIVINGLPVGTRLTINEVPHNYFELTSVAGHASQNNDGYVVNVMLDDAVTVVDESAPELEFTNTRKTGSVKVSKTTFDKMLESTEEFAFKLVVDGGTDYPDVVMKDGVYGTYHMDGAETGADLTGITIADGVSTQNFELSDKDYVLINRLPVGFTYTVTEEMTQAQEAAYKSAVVVSNPTTDSKIEAGKTPEHAYTNTYRSGSLIVQKEVQGNGVHNSKDFTFMITLDDSDIDSSYDEDQDDSTVNNGARITATRFTPNGPADGETEKVEFTQGVAYITLKPGERMRFDGVPTQTEDKLKAEVVELSDAEVRKLKNLPLAGEVEETVLQDKAQNYGKDGYADYEVKANGQSDVKVLGEIVDDSTNPAPMTALFTNIRRVGNLTIHKKVAEAGDRQALFDFELTVTSDRIRPDQINGWYGDLWFSDGVAKFQLGDGQRVTANELPAGAQYSIVEDPKGHIQAGDSPTGVISENGHVTVNITNWLPFVPGTGDDSRLALMTALLVCSMAGLALLAANRRKAQRNG